MKLTNFNKVDKAPENQTPVNNVKDLDLSQKVLSISNFSSPKSIDEELKVFFSDDPKLLNEYYTLRHNAYKYENGWNDFDGSENDFDRQGRIVVATRNGKVVGGMRLMFSDQCKFLSNEIPGTQYDYKKFIKKYDDRENLIIGEISALVVHKDHRDSLVTSEMFRFASLEFKRYGCNYSFSIAPAIVCRNDRKMARRIGYDLEIVINFPWKEKKLYNFTKMFPVYTKLQ